MNKKIQTTAVDHLFEAILCLENKEECERITKICRMLETRGIRVIRGTHRE